MHHLIQILALVCGTFPLVIAKAQVTPLPTTTTAIVGRFTNGPIDFPLAVNLSQFQQTFGSANAAAVPAEVQAREFFANGGSTLYIVRVRNTGTLLDTLVGQASDLSGLNALTSLSDLRLLLVPELSSLSGGSFTTGFAAVRSFCDSRRVFFLLDPPAGLASASAMTSWVNSAVPTDASFCATYFPYLKVTLDGTSLTITSCGAMAAIFANSDTNAGIWKSPAGTGYPLQATGMTPAVNDNDSSILTSANVNPIRQFTSSGIIPYGARTLDRVNEDNRYIPVVRTRGWAAASIQRSLAFAALRSDDATLWSDIRTRVGNYLQSLYTQGAFQGSTPSQAYYVNCDSTTTTSSDIAAHRVKLLYGVALLRASEFDVTQLAAATVDSSRVPAVPILHPRFYVGACYLPYPTEPGFTYHLQTRPSLTSGSWSDLTVTTGDGAWRTSAPAVNAAAAFYRVLIGPGS